jgi:hypothetical protein
VFCFFGVALRLVGSPRNPKIKVVPAGEYHIRRKATLQCDPSASLCA